MIKTIIFDAGGVLIKGSFQGFLDNVSEILGVRIEEDSISDITDDWMRGTITFKEFLEKSSGKSISEENHQGHR